MLLRQGLVILLQTLSKKMVEEVWKKNNSTKASQCGSSNESWQRSRNTQHLVHKNQGTFL